MANILLVDDDKDLVESQKILLEQNGYTVQTAYNMEEALLKIKAFRPNLVLTDLMMEYSDTGFVFGKKIRDMQEFAEIPVFLQTGASKKIGFTFDASFAERKRWLKVDEIFEKPVAPEFLLGKIEQYLKK